jgi:NAD(P)-dependent dehydrogenase (short-subunit alcohol dehydrogenase family)
MGLNRLSGKVVVVTGGTKGIGKGTALVAASEGAHVVIGGRDRREGQSTVEEIGDRWGKEALFVEGDIKSADTCRSLIEEAVGRFGRIDGLVNNAGIFPRGTLLETEEEVFDDIFDVNVKAAFFCSQHAVAAMMKTGGGSIVHMGSTHGYKGAEDLAAYACSKGAMVTLNKHIAQHYAKYRIRSNWITVGWVASEGEVERLRAEGRDPQELHALVPSGRLQTVEDMGYGTVYLLSDEASQVTGTDLHITGAFNL